MIIQLLVKRWKQKFILLNNNNMNEKEYKIDLMKLKNFESVIDRIDNIDICLGNKIEQNSDDIIFLEKMLDQSSDYLYIIIKNLINNI